MNAASLARLRASNWIRAAFVALLFVVGILVVNEARLQFQSRPVSSAATPYSLSLSKRALNWAAPSPETKIAWTDDGLDIQAPKSAYGFQLVSWPIEVRPGASYAVIFDADITSGRMGVGVMDMDRHIWIVQAPIAAGAARLAFTPAAARIQIVLYNDNGIDVASSAVLRRLAIVEAGP